MFDDLLDKIKQKLPERFRGDEVDEEEEIDIEDQTAQHDVDELYDEEDEDEDSDSEDDEEDDDEDDDDDDGEGDEDPAKKRKQLLIRGLLVLVIAYMGFDFLMNQEEEIPVQQVNRPKKKPKKRKPKKSKQQPQKNEAAQASAQEQNEVAKQPVAPVPVEKEPAPEPAPVEPETTPAPEPEPVVAQPVESNQEPLEVEQPNQVVKQVPQNSSSFEMNFENTGEKNQVSENSEDDISNKLDAITQKLEKETEKEIVYVDPPNYEQYGKGLVYNCKDKHWACVDRDPWFQCKDNQQYNSRNGKKSECVVYKTYQSFKDCRTVQVHFINTVAPTPSCE